jgi:phosphoribosylcarboxyaminoimidazole (NCAIR) mutase
VYWGESRSGQAGSSTPTQAGQFSHISSREYIVADSAVNTLAIGKPGAANAALFAAEILTLNDAALYERLAVWCAARAQEVLESKLLE